MFTFKDESPESQDYYSDDFEQPEEKRGLRKSRLAAALLAITLPLGYTMAGNISLGSNSPIEFGQGVALYAACSGNNQINLKPNATFVNGNPGSFRFTSFDVNNVPVECQGNDFAFDAYGETGSAIALFDTNRTSVNVQNNAGTFVANTDSGYSVTNTSTGAFRVTFTNPVAVATDIFRFTLQSSVHTPFGSANSWIISAGTTTASQFIYDSAMDSSGNIYSLAGSANMRINGVTSSGGQGAWITKSDSQGNFLWTQSIMSSSTVWPEGIAIDGTGNILVAGIYTGDLTVGSSTITNSGNSDGFIAKLDSSGNGIWVNKIGGTALDYVTAVAVDSSNNIVVTGWFDSSSLSIAGQSFNRVSSRDIFIAKYDSAGGSLWALQGSTPGNQNQGLDIVIDSSDNIYTSGRHTGALTIGTVSKSGNGSTDGYVARISASGVTQWIVNPGSTASEAVTALALDSAGDVYAAIEYVASFTIAGTTLVNAASDSTLDVALVKYNSSGVAQWVRSINGAGQQLASDITADSSGNIWITGRYQNTATSGSSSVTSNGGYDIYLFRFTSSGTADFVRSVGSTNSDEPGGVHVRNGFFYLTGEYSGSLTFEGTTIASASGSDIDNFVLAFRY